MILECIGGRGIFIMKTSITAPYPARTSSVQTIQNPAFLLALFRDIFVRYDKWIFPLRSVHNLRESSKVTSPTGIFSPAIRAHELLYKWLHRTDQSDYRKLMIFCLFYFLCCQPVYTAVRIWLDRQFSYGTKRDSEHCYWFPQLVRSRYCAVSTYAQ